MKQFSIIVPLYNMEQYAARCLKAIEEQTEEDFEVIIVDDGSQDATGAVCDEYAQKDKRFRVWHTDNRGVSEARNEALKHVEGEYVLFFDGDDYAERDCLKRLKNCLRNDQPDAVIYGYYTQKGNGKREKHPPMFPIGDYRGEEVFDKLLPNYIGVSFMDINRWLNKELGALRKENTALWHSMVKASLIKEYSLRFKSGLKVGEDTCFTSEYLSCANFCRVISDCLYTLVIHPSSTIETYERDLFAMLEGKTALLFARRELTNRIQRRTGKNIEVLWQGTIVLSILQLAFVLSEKKEGRDRKKGYLKWIEYIEQPETRLAVSELRLKAPLSFHKIPFLMLKHEMYRILYIAIWILQKMGYKFVRE